MLGIRKDAVLAFVNGKGWEGPAGQKKKLSSALQAVVDDDWKPLVTKLGDLVEDKSIHSVDLLDADSPQASSSGGWDWKLTAAAHARLEIDALDGEELKQQLIQKVPGQVVTRYTLAASFDASASGNQQMGIWAAGLSLGAQASGQFDWFISGAPDTTLGQALVDAIDKGDFLSPMDLADQLDRAGRSGYWGTCSRFSGTLSAGATLSANVAKTGWSWGLAGKEEQIGFSLGVSGRASVQLDGRFELRVVPEARGTGWALRVMLQRTQDRNRSLGVEISAGVDFSALSRSAKEFLEARLPTAANLDPLAAKLADPGSAVHHAVLEHLTKALGDGKTLELVKLALGASDADAAGVAGKLAQQLAGPLTDKLDEFVAPIEGVGDAAGADIKSWLASTLRQQSLPSDLATAVDDAIKDATDKLTSHIEELAERIEGKAVTEVQELLQPLGSVGEHVQEALDDVAGTVSKSRAFLAIQSGLKRYKALRKRVLAALGDAQRAKLVAKIALSIEESHSVQTMFSALFLRADAGAEQLFAGLWRGQLDELLGMVSTARASGAVEDVSGWLLRSFERTSTESLSVTILGYTFSQSRMTTTKLSVQSDTAGNIIAASGSALTQSDTSNYWTKRQTSLSLTAKLLDPSLPVSRASMDIAGAFTVSGKVMKESFLRDLQQSLGIPGATGAGLRRLLETDATVHMDDKKFWSAVTFMLPLTLDDVQWALFTSRSDDDIRRAVAGAAIECMRQAYRGDGAFGDPPMQFLLDFGRELNKTDVMGGVVKYLRALPASARLDQSTILALGPLGFPELKVSVETPAHRVARATLRLGHLVRSIVDLATLSRALRQALAASSLRPEREVYDSCQPLLERMAAALEPAAVSSLTLTGLGEDVPWPFVTFAHAIADLVGRPRFTPMATIAGAEDRPIPLLPV